MSVSYYNLPMKIPFFSWLFLIPICSLFVNFPVFVVSGQCRGDQRSYLLDMKKNLKFDTTRSTKLVHWNESTDCCSWEGVTCNGGLVVGLNLAWESIFDGLDNSSSLFCLQYLQNLNLAYNELDSPIPPEFGNLTNLRYLSLSYADFEGQIPIEISRLTRLVSLDLSNDNVLENPDLASLVHNLTWLTELYLDGVNISSQGNEWCQAVSSSLPNLRVLSMSGCNLQGPPDSSLLKLQSLSIIQLDDNNFSAPVPEFFSYFRHLTSLWLSSCGLNGQLPKKIFQIPTLQTIDLSFNEILGSLPEFHSNGSLQSLVLSGTNFSGALPDSIGNLKGLSKIDLSRCNFSGSIPNSIANLTQLVHLDLSSNSFTGSILNSIANLVQLVHLDLSSNNFTGSIPNSMTNLTRLFDLYISSNNFTGSIPNFMANLTELVNIEMSSNNFIGPVPSFNMAQNLDTIDLSDNHLTGQFTFTHWKELPSLGKLCLSNNKLSGQIHEFSNSFFLLEYLDLSRNYLEGPIPTSIGKLQRLRILLLSSNNFNGSFQLNVFQQLTNLIVLDLSDNSLLIEYNGTNSSLSPFSLIESLRLASLKLKTFPSFLRNQTSLLILDLSRNQIHGEIPNWIWELDLLQLNLSYNYLEGPLLNLSSLGMLDLRSNQFQGQLPTPPPSCSYLDLSWNNFSSVIPIDIGNYLSNTSFLSLSSNKLNGHIPEAICKATYLEILDLSNNFLSGTIPHCLIAMSETLKVLDLRRNNLTGKISDIFPSNCSLQTLSLNRNLLEGMVPNSLANCTNLELLDIGNNRIQDEFPCHLKDISSLRVLILRSNKFYGSVGCGGLNATWSILQIVDLASNNFSGKLSIKSFANSKAMIANNEVQSELNYLHSVASIVTLSMGRFYERYIEKNYQYQDAIAIFIKGLEWELVKILTLVTSIDLSCNNLDGPIPEEIEVLKSLYVLNLSHNAFTGRIPPSLGKLSELESLDLSSNKLVGGIPMQLADSLTFLSVLNLSFNQLVGPIPYIKQFATFSEGSYEGNKGLCGHPLKAECRSADRRPPAPFEDMHSKSRPLIDWNYLCVELGFVFGFGMVIGPLVLWKRWRIRYYKHADDIFFRIFPQLYLRWEKNHQVQRHRIRMQRH
ncbi:receptor-like protein 7 [Quercus lobata]|uniref:Leucine-rich repeat-containing N-terminal plant-type domain-containing protein n=1 Tax=Quercus lobata TaxID=97700 RepID=A0A7N2MRH1_QUELO|nr:receptor-like protein 7 [Quercus lobata]